MEQVESRGHPLLRENGIDHGKISGKERVPGEWFASDEDEPKHEPSAVDVDETRNGGNGEWYTSDNEERTTFPAPHGIGSEQSGGVPAKRGPTSTRTEDAPAQTGETAEESSEWAEVDMSAHTHNGQAHGADQIDIPDSGRETIVVALIDRRQPLPDGSPPVPDPVEEWDSGPRRPKKSTSAPSPKLSPKDVIQSTLATASAGIHAAILPVVLEGSCGRVLAESVEKAQAAEWTHGSLHVGELEQSSAPAQPMATWRMQGTHFRAALARSAFFSSLLSSQLRSATRVEVSVRDPWTSVEAMQSVLRFLNSGALSGCADPFQLLAAARLLAVPGAVTAAVGRIGEALGPHNIIRALQHARQYSSVELQEQCANFLYKYLHVGNAAQLVSSVFDSSVDHREVARYLRNIPRDCFRELAVLRRRSIQHFFRPRPCYAMCVLKRQKSLDGNWAVYRLYEDHTMKFLLSAARDISTGHLYISNDEHLPPCPHDFQRDQIIAVLEANTFDTQYTMFDNGYNCTRMAASLPGLRRREVGLVTYDTSLTMSSPRSIVGVFADFEMLTDDEGRQPHAPAAAVQAAPCTEAAEDSSDDDERRSPEEGGTVWRARREEAAGGGRQGQGKFRWGCSEGTLRTCLGPRGAQGVVKVVNMEPRWNENLGSYSLNFYSRVKKASKKNFLLVPEGQDDNIVCLFGKMGRDTYALDYKPPLSCVQAFMTALSTFEHRMGIS